MKRYFVLALIFLFLLTTTAYATNYVKTEEFKKWLETGKKMLIVDIQPKDEFEEHHFKGSIETNAFPAKTDEEKKRIDPALKKAKESNVDVVIVCPRGRSGAMNTYEYLKANGIPENRLFILEGGIAGWPYKEIFQKGR